MNPGKKRRFIPMASLGAVIALLLLQAYPLQAARPVNPMKSITVTVPADWPDEQACLELYPVALLDFDGETARYQTLEPYQSLETVLNDGMEWTSGVTKSLIHSIEMYIRVQEIEPACHVHVASGECGGFEGLEAGLYLVKSGSDGQECRAVSFLAALSEENASKLTISAKWSAVSGSSDAKPEEGLEQESQQEPASAIMASLLSTAVDEQWVLTIGWCAASALITAGLIFKDRKDREDSHMEK